MTTPTQECISLVHGEPGHDGVASLCVASGRIVTVEQAPRGRVVDLAGDRLLPGLLNAHDHLQLNDLPAVPRGGPWRNVREWIVHVEGHRLADARFAASAAAPRSRRLMAGGIKNLLAGVTTVAHHDPLYALLIEDVFPTGVVKHYGWAHSLAIDGEDAVCRSHRRTPHGWPWIVHAAEGVDESARDEFDTLGALGCLTANTLMVHAVALDAPRLRRLRDLGAGLAWCPASNLALFGATAAIGELLEAGRVALGTDSRLSGSRDLLDELRIARECASLDEARAERLVTRDAARLLRLGDRGELRVGHRADLLVLPAGLPLGRATRADVRLVMLNGEPRLADPDIAAQIAPPSGWAAIRVDGRPKRMSRELVASLDRWGVVEPGLEWTDASSEAA